MFKYDPHQTKDKDLKATFINGKKYLEDILDDLKPKDKKLTNQCIIITGKRGIGKSHFIKMLYNSIISDKILNRHYLPLIFPEELFNAGTLYHFLKDVLERTFKELIKYQKDYIDIVNKKIGKLNNKFNEICKQRFTGIKKVQIEQRAQIENNLFLLLKELSKLIDKKIIFLLENLQNLFGEKLKTNELKKLRAFLQKYPDTLLIIGTALTTFSGLIRNKEPFYNFFRHRRLTGLDQAEVIELLVNLSTINNINNNEILTKINKYKGEIEVFRILTGGNPRLVLFLFDLLSENEELFTEDILKKLTELTPFFKTETEKLSNAKQMIIHTLCENAPAQTPSEIAEYLNEPVNIISENLKRLLAEEKVRIVEMKKYNKEIKESETFYTISDYFYRIWYQIRQSITADENVKWMAELAVILFNKKELEQKCEYYDESFKPVFFKALELIQDKFYFGRLPILTSEDISEQEEDIIKDFNKLIETGNWKKAIGKANELIKKKIQLEHAYFYLGNVYFETENYKKAIECCEKVIKINSDDYLAFYNMGISYANLKNYKKAIESYEKAIKIKQDYYLSFNNMGNSYADLKNYKKAIECYEKAIKIKPDYYQAFDNMGISYADLKNYNKAIENYEKAIKIKPDYYLFFNNMGNSYADLKNYKKAIECYEKAIKIKPDYFQAFGNMGNSYADLKNYKKAIECYEKVIKINPDDYQAFGNMGISYADLKNYIKAIENYEKAIKIKPDYFQAFYNMGLSYTKIGDYKKAIECYEKVIKIKSDDYQAFNNMGNSYSDLKNHKKAIECYEKVIKINPDDYLAFYNMGYSYAELGDHKKAIEIYKNCINKMSSFNYYDIDLLKNIKKSVKNVYNEKTAIDKLSNKNLSLIERLSTIQAIISLNLFNGSEAIIKHLFTKFENEAEKHQILIKELYFYFMFETILRLNEASGESNPEITAKYFLRCALLLKDKRRTEKKIFEFLINYVKNQDKQKMKKEALQKVFSEWQKLNIKLPESIEILLEALINPNSRDAQVWSTDPLFKQILTMFDFNN